MSSPTKVSILTRPEGRVQLVQSGEGGALGVKEVSILTRPEGRVQRSAPISLTSLMAGFNPHPPRRAGATACSWAGARGGGCFNPHPPRRAGATRSSPRTCQSRALFQSSPAPKGGCNSPGPGAPRSAAASFNPHPPRRAGATWRGWRCGGGRPLASFNPHPPRRAGATGYVTLDQAFVSALFQSSPAPKGGCNKQNGQDALGGVKH